MITEYQKSRQRLDDVKLLAGLDAERDRQLLQQLESLSFLGMEVVHKIATRVAMRETPALRETYE